MHPKKDDWPKAAKKGEDEKRIEKKNRRREERKNTGRTESCKISQFGRVVTHCALH